MGGLSPPRDEGTSTGIAATISLNFRSRGLCQPQLVFKSESLSCLVISQLSFTVERSFQFFVEESWKAAVKMHMVTRLPNKLPMGRPECTSEGQADMGAITDDWVGDLTNAKIRLGKFTIYDRNNNFRAGRRHGTAR